MKTAATFDPINLIPAQASQNENIEYNAHTQVGVPWLRAFSVFRIRLGRAIGTMVLAALAIGSCYWLANGPEWAGWIALSALCLGVCVAWAASAPFGRLERFQMAEIAAPGRDTERQAIAEMVLKFLREQQQPVTVPPVVRIESTVRDNGSATTGARHRARSLTTCRARSTGCNGSAATSWRAGRSSRSAPHERRTWGIRVSSGRRSATRSSAVAGRAGTIRAAHNRESRCWRPAGRHSGTS